MSHCARPPFTTQIAQLPTGWGFERSRQGLPFHRGINKIGCNWVHPLRWRTHELTMELGTACAVSWLTRVKGSPSLSFPFIFESL